MNDPDALDEREWLHDLRVRLSRSCAPVESAFVCPEAWARSLPSPDDPMDGDGETLDSIEPRLDAEDAIDAAHGRQWAIACVEHVLAFYEWDRLVAPDDMPPPHLAPEALRRDWERTCQQPDAASTPAVEEAMAWANHSGTGAIGWAITAMRSGDWAGAAAHCRQVAGCGVRMATWDHFPETEARTERVRVAHEAGVRAERIERRWQARQFALVRRDPTAT